MKDLAPNIVRKRLLIEATYRKTVTQTDVEKFLGLLPEKIGLRIYSDPIVYSPGGEGRDENQGYDGFVALIDSGIAIYVWENQKFLSVVIYSCKVFDEAAARDVTREFFDVNEDDSLSF